MHRRASSERPQLCPFTGLLATSLDDDQVAELHEDASARLREHLVLRGCSIFAPVLAHGVWREAVPGSGQNGSVSEDEDTGRPVLRIAGPNDAVALMKLKQRLDEETSFMLLEPDERDTSTQTLARHLEEVSRSQNSVVIVADQHGDLAGYVELVGGKFRRNRSTTHVIIGVLAEASGKGVGTGLLEEAKRWAAARGVHRIELNVMARNHRAIALYERMGFVREGRRVGCLLIDGKFLDELYMAMILPGSLSP